MLLPERPFYCQESIENVSIGNHNNNDFLKRNFYLFPFVGIVHKQFHFHSSKVGQGSTSSLGFARCQSHVIITVPIFVELFGFVGNA